MPITVPQIPGALTSLGQLMQAISTLEGMLNEAQLLANQNWQLTLSPGIVLTISADQQTALVAQYDGLKAQMAQIYGGLP
jgi:hypothetical protein